MRLWEGTDAPAQKFSARVDRIVLTRTKGVPELCVAYDSGRGFVQRKNSRYYTHLSETGAIQVSPDEDNEQIDNIKDIALKSSPNRPLSMRVDVRYMHPGSMAGKLIVVAKNAAPQERVVFEEGNSLEGGLHDASDIITDAQDAGVFPFDEDSLLWSVIRRAWDEQFPRVPIPYTPDQKYADLIPVAWLDSDGRPTVQRPHDYAGLLLSLQHVERKINGKWGSVPRKTGLTHIWLPFNVLAYSGQASEPLRETTLKYWLSSIQAQDHCDAPPDAEWSLSAGPGIEAVSLNFIDVLRTKEYDYPLVLRLAGTPFAVAFDVVTSPFQALMLIAAAR